MKQYIDIHTPARVQLYKPRKGSMLVFDGNGFAKTRKGLVYNLGGVLLLLKSLKPGGRRGKRR